MSHTLKVKKDKRCLSKSYHKMPSGTDAMKARESALEDMDVDQRNFIRLESVILSMAIIDNILSLT